MCWDNDGWDNDAASVCEMQDIDMPLGVRQCCAWRDPQIQHASGTGGAFKLFHSSDGFSV
jgi:hypothetical protein